MINLPVTLTLCAFILDLLQEPNPRARHIVPCTPFPVHGSLPRDRFVHQCNRTSYRGQSRTVYRPEPLSNRPLQVGDGLEMYVVLAKNSPSIQGLRDVRGLSELTATEDGERVFVVRRDLKKD